MTDETVARTSTDQLKWRKKPVVIEAMRIPASPEDSDPLFAWLADCEDWYATTSGVVITTLEGEMRGYAGDWIIKGVKGEYYPCKNDIFEATYEPA